jgi:transposase-like protein
MRYRAAEKREVIDLVERSSLPVRRTLDRLGIPKSTFYGWYERYREGGDAALEDTRPSRGKTWNRLPDLVRQSILKLALERPELSARELAVLYTERQRYFVSESSVYRLLKAHDLITSPAFVVIKAADEFRDKTTAINQNLYYRWSKEFLEAGKKRLAGDTAREANTDEVKGLRNEAAQLKEALAETGLGATIHEIPSLGKTRDHRPGGTFLAAGPANTGSSGHPQIDLLRLVRALPGRRRCCPGGYPSQQG